MRCHRIIRLCNIGFLLFSLFIQNAVWAFTPDSEYIIESSTFSQQESKNQNRKNTSKVINLDLTNVSMKNTLHLLTESLNKNLILDHEVEERNLNVSLKKITAIEAFNAILEANNLAYKELEGNVYFVANAEKIEKSNYFKPISPRSS